MPPLRAAADRRVVVEMEPAATTWTLAVATATGDRSRAVEAFPGLVDAHVVDRDRF